MCEACIVRNTSARPPAPGTLEARLAALVQQHFRDPASCSSTLEDAIGLSTAAVEYLFDALSMGDYLDTDGFHPMPLVPYQ
jgi:hypothetical protein